MRVDVKPLSVNKVWQGRRFKMPEYHNYEKLLLLILPKYKLPEPPYEIHFTFGLSSTLFDWDNSIKPLQDILSKKYGFNDKLIFKGVVEKVKVDKGNEFFDFEIIHYEI